MSALATSCLVFVLIFAGAVFGMALRRALPKEHFGTDAKDTVRLAIGLVGTMTGLVLGLLVSSAKTYYDAQGNQVALMSSEIIALNEMLVSFGPEADPTRARIRKAVEDATNRIWSGESQRFELRPKMTKESPYVQLEALVPKNEEQATLKAQILSLSSGLRKTSWLMFLESEQTSVSMPLLVVVTSWLVAIFISYGMFAPPNWTVVVTLFVSAIAVSAAIFLILEMYSPFSGILQISPAAVRDALSQMAAER